METGNWKPGNRKSTRAGIPANLQFPVSSSQFRFSSFRPVAGRALGALLCAAAILAAPHSAAAQGCAMCYTSAAAAKKAGIQALQHGILILLVPPLLMFLGIFWYTFRRRGSLEAEGAAPLEEVDSSQLRAGPPESRDFSPETLFPKSASSNTIEEGGARPHLRE
jgi:hypothetical protein